ncbi:kinase-like protein [Cylindrobasidium torrendii FP15055 ss-10]|uniref:Kinase-like protein n=1 Tax=Cylindrobasidium torrendii FP15055 ss-10 TaxID=1314674 RepID=A0A0D7B9D1_9AGAR|nr:kinase-like protein [Cylindrobasidium torrendii FP15055 ss-10]
MEEDPDLREKCLFRLQCASCEVDSVREKSLLGIQADFEEDSMEKKRQRDAFFAEKGFESRGFFSHYALKTIPHRTNASKNFFWHENDPSTRCLYQIADTRLCQGRRGRVRVGRYSDADDATVGTVCAIKTIFYDDHRPRIYMAAKKEADTMRKIQHSNFVKLYTTVEVYGGTQTHIAMKFFDGIDLLTWERASSEGFGEKTICHIARELLQGLIYLHETAGLIHCDLSLKHILMDSHFRVKIIGLSHAIQIGSKDSSPVSHHLSSNTDAEVFRLNKWMPSADIWSMGIVLAQLAFGEHHGHGDKSALAKDARAMPGKIGDFFERCLARRAGNRWDARMLYRHQWLENLSVQPSLIID